MKSGSTIKTSAVALMVTLIAAGCGTSSQVTSAPSHGKPTVGGSISINASPHGPWADVFNPYSPGENQDDIVPDIYEPLIQWNSNNGQSLPWLATKWSWNTKGNVLTMNLRRGVKWTNGRPFTSRDVVFTLDMLRKYPAADTNALWSYMTGVQADGSYAVKITLNHPNSTFLYYLGETLIVPESQWKNVNPVTYADTHPIGTGPYVLKSFSPEEIVLTRNPNYWNHPQPYIQTVYYPAETSNSSDILALDSGSLQWASFFSPNLQHEFVDRNPKVNHIDLTADALDILYLNNQRYPLNIPAVRRALSDAINRRKLSVIAESGYSTPTTLNGIPKLMASQWSTPTEQKNAQAVYNPKLAKSLLLKAGFKMGKNGYLVTPQGHEFSMNLVVASPFTDFVTLSSIMASDFRAIGINASVEETSVSNYLTKLEVGNFSAGVCWSPSGPTPFYTLNQLMNTNYSAPIGKVATANYERFSDPAVETLARDYESTTNFAKQKVYDLELAKIMQREMPVIPLLNRMTPNEYSTAHIAGWPSPSHPYWDNSSDSGPIVVLNRLYYVH